MQEAKQEPLFTHSRLMRWIQDTQHNAPQSRSLAGRELKRFKFKKWWFVNYWYLELRAGTSRCVRWVLIRIPSFTNQILVLVFWGAQHLHRFQLFCTLQRIRLRYSTKFTSFFRNFESCSTRARVH